MINTRVRGCVCSVGMRCMGHVAVPRTSSVGAYGIGSFSLSAFPVLAEASADAAPFQNLLRVGRLQRGDVRGSIYEPVA